MGIVIEIISSSLYCYSCGKLVMEYQTISDKSTTTESAMTVGAGGDNNNGVEQTSSETSDMLMKEVENILEELNEKRDSDKKLVDEFRTKMHELVEDLCGQLEQQLLATYEKTNSTVQSKLESLKDLASRITFAETELTEFEKAVGIFFRKETSTNPY